MVRRSPQRLLRLATPYTQDIRNYRSAVEWIRGQIDATPGGTGNDTRWWVSVPAI